MDAPKCKICGERHRLGACPASFPKETAATRVIPTARHMRVEVGGAKTVDLGWIEVPKTWRRGRRIAGEAHLTDAQQKPWEPLGMSRATYYRRKREGKL